MNKHTQGLRILRRFSTRKNQREQAKMIEWLFVLGKEGKKIPPYATFDLTRNLFIHSLPSSLGIPPPPLLLILTPTTESLACLLDESNSSSFFFSLDTRSSVDTDIYIYEWRDGRRE